MNYCFKLHPSKFSSKLKDESKILPYMLDQIPTNCLLALLFATASHVLLWSPIFSLIWCTPMVRNTKSWVWCCGRRLIGVWPSYQLGAKIFRFALPRVYYIISLHVHACFRGTFNASGTPSPLIIRSTVLVGKIRLPSSIFGFVVFYVLFWWNKSEHYFSEGGGRTVPIEEIDRQCED